MGRLQLQIRVVAVILMKEAGLKHGILNCTDRSNRLGANDLLLLHVIGMQRHLQFIAQHRKMGCTFHHAVNALNPIALNQVNAESVGTLKLRIQAGPIARGVVRPGILVILILTTRDRRRHRVVQLPKEQTQGVPIDHLVEFVLQRHFEV